MVVSINDLDHYPFLRGAYCARTESRYGLSSSPLSCCALDDGHPQRARCSSWQAVRQCHFLAPVGLKLMFLWATAVLAIDPRHPLTSPACSMPMLIPALHALPLLANASTANTPSTVHILWRDERVQLRCEHRIAAGWTSLEKDWTNHHNRTTPSSREPPVIERYTITSSPFI